MANYIATTSDRSRKVALLLCVFLGWLGFHQFYVGRVGKGLLYLFTFGFLPKFLCTILLSLVSNHASFISGGSQKNNCKKYENWLTLYYTASVSDILGSESVFLPLDRYIIRSHIRWHVLFPCTGLLQAHWVPSS